MNEMPNDLNEVPGKLSGGGGVNNLMRQSSQLDIQQQNDYDISIVVNNINGDDDALQIICDEQRLSQVILNLLARLLKIMSSHSMIEIHIGFNKEEMKLSIELRMSTAGIARDDIQNIVDEFSCVKKQKRLDQGGKGIAFLIS